MILFHDDWDKYPTASIHFETNNQSFIDLALLYRDMGVKNNAFHLALHDPDLRYIDPHDFDSLDERTIGKIAVECKVNPWYFMREVLRAPASSGTETIKVRANRANIALWWLFLNHCTLFLIQPRQTGKSFNTDGIMTWLMEIKCDNTKFNLLTKDDQLRRKNIARIKDIMASLPPYLDIRSKKDINNGEEITVKAKGNTYTTHVAQSSKKAAENTGRGLTTAVFHVDEPPFIKNIGITLPAALSSMNAAIDNAKMYDAPYGIIYTTTAGKKDDPDGKYIYQQVMESMVFDERKLYDCVNQEELERTVRKNSKADKRVYRDGVYQVNCTFSHRQLGYDDKWLMEAMERTKSFGDEANRDYFNIWTAGNEKMPISVQDAEAIARVKIDEPKEWISEFGYTLRYYKSERELLDILRNRDCIMGLDTSEASGNDDIGLTIIDAKSLEVVACGTYNETNIYSFGKYILHLLTSFPKLKANIEAKSTGVAIINYLLITLPEKGINPFKVLFNRIVQERDDSDLNKERYQEVLREGRKEYVINKYKKYIGYSTAGSGNYSRDNLYGSCFRNAIKHTKEKIKDPVLSDQILGLVIKNGRIDHDEYGHDDMVVSWLLAHWFITHGKNLEFYDLDPLEIFSEIEEREIKTYEDYQNYQEEIEQLEIRKKMISVYNELENTTDYYLTNKLEQELRNLNSKLILKDREIFSIDQLIQHAKENRKKVRPKSYFAPVNTIY